MKNFRLIFILFILGSFSSIADQKINNIIVKGNQRIETSTIISYLDLKKNENFTQRDYENSLKSLYSTSLFEDIKISYSSGKLYVQVEEFPVITKVEFKGNKKIGKNSLKKIISTYSGSTLNSKNLAQDVLKIKAYYKSQGRYAVEIFEQVKKLDNNRAEIYFNINEGPKTTIKHISFVGNSHYTDNELKSILLTKENSLLTFLGGNDTYNPEMLEHDKIRLKRFYNSLGYLQFNVVSVIAELSNDKKHFRVIFTVNEGERYFISNTKITSEITAIDARKFEKYLKIKNNEFYNIDKIETIRDSLNKAVQDMGFYQSTIDPVVTYDPESNNLLVVSFVIKKASKATINKITITGNSKTQDDVIRRELGFSEGDIFDAKKVKSGEENVRNLNFFDEVNMESQESMSYSKKVDIILEGKEKSTAQVGLSVGYDSAQGALGRFNISEINFAGTGNALDLSVEKYSKRLNLSVGYTNNNFLNRDLLLGSTVFTSNSKGFGKEPYSMSSSGLMINFGYKLTDNLVHKFSYLLKSNNLSNAIGTSQFVQDQLGKYVTSAIINELIYTSLDSKVIPKNGYMISLSQSLSGFGGNNKYLKHEIETQYFKSFYDNKITLKLSAEAGKITGNTIIFGKSKVRLNDRFSLGEPNFRGFEPSGIGPRDKTTSESLNGQNYYRASIELQFPLGLPKEYDVRGAIFVDAGSLWGIDKFNTTLNMNQVHNDQSLRASVGFGLIWNTAIAPLRIDYGIPIVKKKYDETKRFHIKLSTNF